MTYSDNGILDLLRLTWLRLVALGLDTLQLLLITLDPALKLRDIVAGELVPPIKHLPHTDESVAHGLQVFNQTLIPRPRLVFQQLLRGAEVLRSAFDPLIEQRNVVCVDGVSVSARLGERRQIE